MATPTETATGPAQDQTVEQKIQHVQELFADASEVGRKATWAMSRLAASSRSSTSAWNA